MNLPPRMTTQEVLDLARISAATFHRRRKIGTIKLEPCERGQQWLWKRTEVIRALGMEAEFGQPQEKAEPNRSDRAMDPVVFEWVKLKANPRTRRRLTKGLEPPAWFHLKDGSPPLDDE
jgi:hypothetical protein